MPRRPARAAASRVTGHGSTLAARMLRAMMLLALWLGAVPANGAPEQLSDGHDAAWVEALSPSAGPQATDPEHGSDTARWLTEAEVSDGVEEVEGLEDASPDGLDAGHAAWIAFLATHRVASHPGRVFATPTALPAWHDDRVAGTLGARGPPMAAGTAHA